MNDILTNLLPPERQRALSRGYFLRLGVVVAIMVSALTIISGLLLLPTHVFLTQSAATKQAHLANIESILSSSNEVEVSARLAALSNDIAILATLGNAPSASATLRSILAIPHPGVALSGFVYTPPAGGSTGTLSVSGVATTREALRSYQLALQTDPFATTADLPVSVYAKSSNIAFTVSMTLAP
ncbi:hypothetical protein EXS57_03490 [Candidatus Kaiserbacteria bacterium]|nr:hypothetical protein [Candidatus Kaiserbacteria bacterium]